MSILKLKWVLALVALLSFQLAMAQGLWQDEAILRSNVGIEWYNSVISTPTGESIVLWEKGKYGCMGLFLSKLNPDGEMVWNEPIQLGTAGYTKWNMQMTSDTLGNLFVSWTEGRPDGQHLYIAKLNLDGQLLWQPLADLVWGVNIIGIRPQPDNTGGLYLVLSQSTGNNSYNIFCQKLSPDGQALLPGGGVQLTNETVQTTAGYVKLASDNGLIISYGLSMGSIISHKLMRMLPDYTVDWQITYDYHNPASWGGGGGGLVPADSNRFILIWNESYEGLDYLYMQKYDEDGQALFNPPIQIAGGTGVTNVYPSLANDNQGALYIGVHTGSNIGPMTNRFYKYNYNGEELWQNPVVLPDSVVSIVYPVPDGAGGCYALLKSIRGNVSNPYDYSIQHINSDGVTTFTGLGQEVLSQIPYAYQYVAYTVTDRMSFFWLNRYNDMEGLYFQSRNLAGQLLTNPRVTIVESLCGSVALLGLVRRQNDVLAYWSDSREFDGTTSYVKLYYRIVQPDGSMSQPQDGTPLSGTLTANYQPRSVHLPDGNTVIIWHLVQDGSSYIYGQAINPQGSILWEPEGRVLALLPGVNGIASLLITNDGNDIYISWYHTYQTDQTRTFLQKVTDGQPMWGTGGLMINTGLVSDTLIDRPLYLNGRYLVLRQQTALSGAMNILALRFEPDGTPSTGWGSEGIELGNYAFNSQATFSSKGAVLDGNLYFFWYYGTYWDRHYLYSVVMPDGSIPVSQQFLLNDPWVESYLMLDNSDGLAFALSLQNNDPVTSRLGYCKLDNYDQYPWGETAMSVIEPIGSVAFSGDGINGFDDGGYLVTWLQNYKVYGFYINSQGIMQSELGGSVLAEKCESTFLTAQLDNEMYIAWNDYKAASYSYYQKEIRMQKFANLTTTSIPDETAALPTLLACYPNPFGDRLSIEVFSPVKGRVKLAIYNIKGQKVCDIIDGILDKGSHSCFWDGRDLHGRQVASGVYYIHYSGLGASRVSKVLFLK